MNLTLLEDCLRQISLQAGNEILNVYQNMNLDIEYKVDTSPVTQADKLANSLICEKLNYFSLIFQL
jgi:3'(2'), 5'-bisphosphate nucleotidase